MKHGLLIIGLAGWLACRASAQVTVEVTTEQDQFLPSERLPVAVKITNQSGQSLHLGENPNWLTFNVEADDRFIVSKLAEAPVLGEFDLGSSQVATIHVDLKPCFDLTRPGRYRIYAYLHIKGWNLDVTSPAKSIDVISGAKLWSQNFGLPVPAGQTNLMPEVRKYTLEKANYLKSQLRLYVEVSDESESRVFNVVSLGKMVAFGDPDARLDRFSNLHVLWQSGSSFFTYAMVNPDGSLLKQEIYDYVSTRPRLAMNDIGDVSVLGGVRRLTEKEMPMVKSPLDLPSPAR